MIKASSHILAKKRRRHVFGMFRRQLLTKIAPVWLCFIGIDYLYRPDLLEIWVPLRLAPLVPWLAGRLLLRKSWVRERYTEALAMAAVTIPALSVIAMVYMSGGVSSIYVAGAILTVITGISLFQLNTRATNIVNIMTYGTAIAVFWIAPATHSVTESAVMSLIFAAMILLNFITKGVEGTSEAVWASAQIDAFKAFRKARRTEMLTVHFPPEIRRRIEAREVEVGRVEFLDDCVVGFADIAGSTEIANAVSLREDWAIKEGFINLAKKRAKESGMIVPTHTGDGCLFIANYLRKDGWQLNTIAFFENLQRDYELLRATFPRAASHTSTALRFGIAKGPAGIGFLGDEEQSYYTAIGSTVNLAARLTAKANANEIVTDQGVWSGLENVLLGWDVKRESYDDLKGFSKEVPAFHIKPRTSARKTHKCGDCGETLVIYQTADGFIDLVCPNGHVKGESSTAA